MSRVVEIELSDGCVIVADAVGTSGMVVCPVADVATRIASWFPGAPEEVTEALGELQRLLNARRNSDGVQAMLGITID